jgi:hypothetical protein
VFSAATALSLLVTPLVAQAKAGDIVYRGIVTARPSGKIGTWVVGGRSFRATAATQLDIVDGPLKVGACAKVKIRASAVKGNCSRENLS